MLWTPRGAMESVQDAAHDEDDGRKSFGGSSDQNELHSVVLIRGEGTCMLLSAKGDVVRSLLVPTGWSPIDGSHAGPGFGRKRVGQLPFRQEKEQYMDAASQQNQRGKRSEVFFSRDSRRGAVPDVRGHLQKCWICMLWMRGGVPDRKVAGAGLRCGSRSENHVEEARNERYSTGAA